MKKIILTILTVVLVTSAWGSGTIKIVGSPSWTSPFPWHQKKPPDNAMRYQCRFDKDAINYAGTITEIELYTRNPDLDALTFYNVRAYLAHTHDERLLKAKFEDNYVGPLIQVSSRSSYTISYTSTYYWDALSFNSTFNYNGTDHLLLEIRWKGHNDINKGALIARDKIFAWRRGGAMYAYDDAAAEGTYIELESHCIYARIYFNYFSDVAATSLGRVKALYR